MVIRVALLALVLAGASSADPFDPARWRALVEGKTLTYRDQGELHGYEYYEPGSNRVLWQDPQGTCLEGTWLYRDGLFCFDWEHDPELQCYLHEQDGDKITVLGVDPFSISTVTSINPLPLSCDPMVIG